MFLYSRWFVIIQGQWQYKRNGVGVDLKNKSFKKKEERGGAELKNKSKKRRTGWGGTEE